MHTFDPHAPRRHGRARSRKGAALLPLAWLGAAAAAATLGTARMLAAPAADAGTPSGRLAAISLKDGAGKGHSLAKYADRKALVVVFLGTTCPISNTYVETLSALQAKYAARGVQFLGVNANANEDGKTVAKHAKEFRLGFPVLKDPDQRLADELGARITPEAFVLDADRQVRYRGRIDDGYASRALKNAVVRRHDLEDALNAVLDGKPVPASELKAVGCAIVRPVKTVKGPAKVTFHRDVLPILQNRCQNCHRPGEVAPFSLLTYTEAKNWAADIKEYTQTRQMPPWQAEPGHGDFKGERRLSDQELTTLAQWVDTGAPEGSAKDAPPTKKWPTGWSLGEPDLVLTMPEYTVPGDGDDEFRVFVLPTGLLENKQVIAIDFRPGNARVVHHVVSFVDRTGQARKLDEADPKPGYESGPGGIKVPNVSVQGVWAPGNFPRFLPPGVGRPLPKGADLAIQMHYHKTGKPETDQTKMGLYFAKEPVRQAAVTTIVGPFNIDIPPDAARHEVKLTSNVGNDLELLTIMPHMHLLGKEMKVWATLPDGTKKDLVYVKNWNYRWQDSFEFKEPVKLPKGTKLDLVAYFDNSTANPLNPNNPPRRVRFGEQTTDEMAFAILEAVVNFRPAIPPAAPPAGEQKQP